MELYRTATYSPVTFIGTNCRLTGAVSGYGEVQLEIPTTGSLNFSLWLRAADVAEYIFGDWCGEVDDTDDGDPRDAGAFTEQCRRDNPVL